MYKHFLKYLVDPKTGEDLQLESTYVEGNKIIDGYLISPSNSYPIIRGIPRFSGYNDASNYTKSFGWQWNKWSKIQFDSQNINKLMQGYTLNMWNKITGRKSTENLVIADFGCGPGRFIEVIRNQNAIAIGIDLSDAVEAAQENFRHDLNVLICQADILNPPLRPGSLDGVFSIGVLHHTTNPKLGFKKMIESIKVKGWVALSVYSRGGYYDDFFVQKYRKFFKLLWPLLGHYPPLIYSYITVSLLRPILKVPFLRNVAQPLFSFFPFVNLPDKQWSVLDTFDSVTPSHQSAHSIHEVFQWFKSENLTEIEPGDWGGATFHAIKKTL